MDRSLFYDDIQGNNYFPISFQKELDLNSSIRQLINNFHMVKHIHKMPPISSMVVTYIKVKCLKYLNRQHLKGWVSSDLMEENIFQINKEER